MTAYANAHNSPSRRTRLRGSGSQQRNRESRLPRSCQTQIPHVPQPNRLNLGAHEFHYVVESGSYLVTAGTKRLEQPGRDWPAVTDAVTDHAATFRDDPILLLGLLHFPVSSG
jgi:hypothetical protein